MIWDVLDEKISINNRHIGTIQSGKLMMLNIEIPNIQRIRDDDKVKDIVAYQLLKLKKNGSCNFIGCINIHYCEENQQLYLVDGQHRFEAIKQINQTVNIPVFVEIVRVDTIDELKENYNMINKNTPLPEFPETIDKTIPERIAEHYKRLYPDMWSGSKRPNRPHIYFGYFQEALGVLVERMDLKSVTELQEIMDNHNTKLGRETFTNCSDKQLKKCKDAGFYFGLYSHISDEYRYDWVRELLNIEKAKQPNTKRKIPKKVKEDAWNKYVGADKSEIPCLCCGTSKITPFTFHAGHVISEANGGHVTVSNIRPICSACNLSMGSRNMPEFIEAHYPKTIENKKTIWSSLFGL